MKQWVFFLRWNYLHFFEKIKGFLIEPSKTFNASREESSKGAIKYYLVIAVIYSLIFAAFSPRIGYMDIAIFWKLLASEIVAIFVSGAVIHAGVYFVGGRKGITQTIKAVMYGATPGLLLGWIIFSAIPPRLSPAINSQTIFLGWTFIDNYFLLMLFYPLMGMIYGFIGIISGITGKLSYAASITDISLIFISTLLSIVSILWSVALWVIGIRQLHELTTRRAIEAVLVPMIPAAMALFIPMMPAGMVIPVILAAIYLLLVMRH